MGSIPMFRIGSSLPAVRRQLRTRARWSSRSIQAARYSSARTIRPRVAVLYQALEPPVIDGIKKPKKPNGYKDSGADIAFNLGQAKSIDVITPTIDPSPTNDGDWTFPDTENGILEAIKRGATHLWANTILFASHPLQTSAQIGQHAEAVRVIGQSPLCVDRYDNKDWVNTLLRRSSGFTMPRSWAIARGPAPSADALNNLPYPVVAKPIRGRGSHGVKVCRGPDELAAHAKALADEDAAVMLEEFLQGEEGTVTVMPPTAEKKGYWALPLVSRFNHLDGIAPYNGTVSVTANSRVVPDCEKDPIYAQVMRESERAAELLGVTAPIRIDVRRYGDSPDSKFAFFDVNMKPVDYTPKAASIANATDFETSLGVDHACIVLPSVYGTNNSILLDALHQFNGSYRGVAVIDPDSITNTTLDVFQELYTPLASLLYLHDYIVDSGVTFAFDHFGHTLVGSKTNVSMNTYDPYRTPGFRELIDLVQKKLMFVKISGPYRDSNQAPLYEDMRVVAETIINAGPDMVVYGSDWPHTNSKEGNDAVGGRLNEQDFRDINDAALVEITKGWAGSDAQIQRLFVDNPRRLWQWYEDS
ncbi:hypothetical protein Daus18300_004128 [Diaporthe australafricana]|uniref:ATP-grasp domain-containing protein n=1 Tax=Diaporthe australafricana TaxID=127596 RepID=A0ABR3XAK3_9PEZI